MKKNIKKQINKTQYNLTKTIIIIDNKIQLKKLILSGKFDNPIQVKNTEHICNDGSIYDYSSIVKMDNMFHFSEFIIMPELDTSNVTNMNHMFYDCKNLKKVPFFNTSNVTNMKSMFESCFLLETVPLFDTSNVTTMEDMFFNCQSITFIPNFNTKNVINMEFTFACCYKLEKIPTWFFDKKKCSVFDIFYDTNFSIIEKLKFFYQDDKLLVKSLDIHDSSNLKIPNNKLDELLLKYE